MTREVLDENALSINSNEEHLLSIKDKWQRLMNVDKCSANHNPLSIANVSDTPNEIRRLHTFVFHFINNNSKSCIEIRKNMEYFMKVKLNKYI
jgi:hypothetical protein